MAQIRLRIGAALDPSARGAFRPLVEAAKRARREIEKELGGAGNSGASIGKGVEAGANVAAPALRKIAQNTAELGRKVDDLGKKLGSSLNLRQAVSDAERELARLDRAMQRTAGRGGGGGFGAGGGGDGGTFARRTGYWAVRNFSPVTPMLGVGARLGRDLLNGAGIRTDLGSYVSNFVEAGKAAADLSNAGFMRGDAGPNGKRVSASVLMGEASKAAVTHAMSQTDILGGLQSFVGKTGDLASGRAVLNDMAKLARATGSSFEDMMAAAADVSNQLGDMPNKGKALQAVMAGVAGQGKLGAVEVRDLASQMAKVAASASKFSGDRADTILVLGALAQEARQRGGAASASQAATSVQGFANTLTTPARVAAFKAAGIDVYDKSGLLRGPQQIIMDALSKTGGDPVAFKKLFANTSGARAVEGFAGLYRGAGGGAQGLQAVSDEFARLKRATLEQTAIAEDYAESMDTDDARAKQFSATMQNVVNDMSAKLLPALNKLAPSALGAAESFGKFATMAADNPGSAIAVALGAAIGKAGIEQALRGGIEAIISGKTLGGAAAMGGGAAAGSALAIASVAVASFVVTKMIVESMVQEDQDKRDSVVKAQINAGNAGGVLRSLLDPGSRNTTGVLADDANTTLAPYSNETIEKARDDAAKAMDALKGALGNAGGDQGASAQLLKIISGVDVNKERADDLRALYDSMDGLAKTMTSGGLKVEVINMPKLGPVVDDGGRTPPPRPGNAREL